MKVIYRPGWYYQGYVIQETLDGGHRYELEGWVDIPGLRVNKNREPNARNTPRNWIVV